MLLKSNTLIIDTKLLFYVIFASILITKFLVIVFVIIDKRPNFLLYFLY